MRVYATEEVIGLLERDVFNWNVYPRFSDLRNDYGPVMEYVPIPIGRPFSVAHLSVVAVPVNHIVPTVGLVVSDGQKSVAFSSDTAETEEFWKIVNRDEGSRCFADRDFVSESNGQAGSSFASLHARLLGPGVEETHSQRHGHHGGPSQTHLSRRDQSRSSMP